MINDILRKFEGARKTSNGYVVKCPVHDDKVQSLSIADNGQRILMKCFAGCTVAGILGKVGLEWKHLFHQNPTVKPPRRPSGYWSESAGLYRPKHILDIYQYRDEEGKLLYENVRYDPKEFRQRQYDGSGTPIYNLQGVRRVPYRLPQLLPCIKQGSEMWLCEGEKDADALAELGLTTSSFKNWSREFNRYIRDARVVIVQDHDKPGTTQANEAARIIRPDVESVKVLDVHADSPMQDKHGPDISDYIYLCVKDEGMVKEEIVERLSRMADNTPEWVDPEHSGRRLFRRKTINEWLQQAKLRPSPKMLFGEFWFEGELCILFADTNVGKSILAVQAGDMITRGVSDGPITVETPAQKVVYFDFELTDKQLEARFSERLPGEEFNTNHHVFDDKFIRNEMDPESPDLDGFATFEEYLSDQLDKEIRETGARVLIIDNITYLRDETENARNALPLMKYLKELKTKYNLSILALAHTPKRDASKPLNRNDLQGSKMLINFCDSAFAIGESAKDTGLRYLKQIKARNTAVIYHGDNVLLSTIKKEGSYLKFSFLETANERAHLKTESEKERDKTLVQVRKLASEGKTQREIAEILAISAATVNRYLKKDED